MGQQEALPHLESHWDSETQTWGEPTIVESPYLAIHGLCPAINYGQQAFEGMKAFKNEKGEVRVFRCNDHGARFRNSAMFVSIPEVPEEHFSKCIQMALGHNHASVPAFGDGSFMYVRPLLFGSSPAFIPGPHNNYTFCIFAWPYKPFMGREPLVAQIEEEVDHAATRGFGQAKIGGNYAPFVRWTEKARKFGFTTSLFLDSQTQTEVEEFTFSGFIGIKKNGDSYTLVGTNCNRVVKSLTADSCYEIARTLGWNVEIRKIHKDELKTFDEVVSAGTASSVLPVGSITYHSTGEKYIYVPEGEKIGPAAAVLEAQMAGIQQGTIEDIYSWTTLVDDPNSAKAVEAEAVAEPVEPVVEAATKAVAETPVVAVAATEAVEGVPSATAETAEVVEAALETIQVPEVVETFPETVEATVEPVAEASATTEEVAPQVVEPIIVEPVEETPAATEETIEVVPVVAESVPSVTVSPVDVASEKVSQVVVNAVEVTAS